MIGPKGPAVCCVGYAECSRRVEIPLVVVWVAWGLFLPQGTPVMQQRRVRTMPGAVPLYFDVCRAMAVSPGICTLLWGLLALQRRRAARRQSG